MALNELYGAGMLNSAVGNVVPTNSSANTSNAILSQHNLLAHSANMHNAALLAATNTTVISSRASAMFLHNHNSHAANDNQPNSLPDLIVNNSGGNSSNPLSKSIVSASTTTTIVNSNPSTGNRNSTTNSNQNMSGGDPVALAAAAKSERKPLCARCRNHNLMIAVKGHKRYCDFRDCICEKCLLTQERRVIMAKQVALSRHQSEDLMAGRIGQTTRAPLVKRLSHEDYKDSPGWSNNKKARISSASNSPASSAASSSLNTNNDLNNFNALTSSTTTSNLNSTNSLTSPRDLAALSVNNLSRNTSTSSLNSHLNSMSIGNAGGLNLGLLGNELSSLSGLTRLNPNLCNLGNLSGAASLAASLGTNLQSYSTTNSNSPTIRSSPSNTQGAIIVDDDDDDQNSFTSESTAEICRSVYEQRAKLANKNNLRSVSNTSSNRLSTGSTGSSASSSAQSLAQTTPPTLGLLEQQHSLINSAAHLPQHSLHSQAHHPLSHQSALLNLNQSNLPTSLTEATNSIISSCATSATTSSTAANTASTNQNSTNLTSALSHNANDSNTTNNLHSHHQSPYNLSALNSFSNLSSLNSLNNFGVYNPLAVAAAHQQSAANRNNDNQSSTTQQSTIHHHPLFSNTVASAHQPNFSSLIEHGSSLGLSSSSILPDILSNHGGRLLSDSAFQLDSLANNSQVAKNLLSAAGINSNSIPNSAINQRTQQHLQQLQLQHHLQQNHLQQLHNQQQRLARSKSNDSDNSDLDEQYDPNEFNQSQLRHLNYLKNKDKRLDESKEGDESKGKKKDKRDLEMTSNKNKQNGHCNNSKLDHHFNERDDDEDDYSNYNKKKIYIFSNTKQRRSYQSTNSSNQTSSSNSNNSSGNNGKKCPQNDQESEEDFEFIDYDSDNEQNGDSKNEQFFLDKSNERDKNRIELDQNQNELISSATDTEELIKNSELQINKQNELNSSINSTYSTGSVISCCGTTRMDVNSSTNSNNDESSKRHSDHFDEDNEEECVSDDDTIDQDTVLQKQADSTNSIISNKHSKSHELTNRSTGVFSNESFEKTDKKSKKILVDKLTESLSKLSIHLNKSENEHLLDYLVLAFIKDNDGQVESCIKKINEVYNDLNGERIGEKDLINYRLKLKNQILNSPFLNEHQNVDNEDDSLRSRRTELKEALNLLCNENEINVISLDSSTNSD